MPKFENAARTIEATSEKPKERSRAKRTQETYPPRVTINSDLVDTRDEEIRIRAQIAALEKSESIKEAKAAIEHAQVAFTSFGGDANKPQALFDTTRNELQAAMESLEQERTLKLAEKGHDNDELLQRNSELQTQIRKLLDFTHTTSSDKASTDYITFQEQKRAGFNEASKKLNTQTLETYQAKKQAEFATAKKLEAAYAKQVKDVLGVDPEEISTLSRWEQLKLSAKDLFNGGIIALWRKASEAADKLAVETQSYGSERAHFTYPSPETVKKTQEARARKARQAEPQKEETKKSETIEKESPDERSAAEATLQRLEETEKERHQKYDEAKATTRATQRKRILGDTKITGELPRATEVVKLAKEQLEVEAMPQIMNVKEAGKQFPTFASRVWEFVDTQLEELKKKDSAAATNANAQLELIDPSDRTNNGRTKYVFALARYKKALESQNPKQIAETKSVLDTLNKALRIDERNSLIAAALAEKTEEADIDVMKGTRSRQRTVMKSNARWRT